MSESTALWYFESVDLFNTLYPDIENGEDKKYTCDKFDKGQFIYFPQDQSSHIYMIAEGRVKIGSYTSEGKELVKAIISKGEVFGELALTGELSRTDFAQALDDDTLTYKMKVEDMLKLMNENKEISDKIFKLIGLRIRKLESRVESLVFKDVRSRVLEFIKDAAQWKGQKVGYETLVKTKLTHKDIADLTGTSRQTVTTILNELKEKNLISFNRRRILIRDVDKLT